MHVYERGIGGLAFLQGNAEFTDLYPRPRLVCRKPLKTAQQGDTLISVRAPVGAINRADQAYCIGRGLAAIRFRGADADFGYQALTLSARALRRVSQGTTFEAVGGLELRGLDFPLPPLPEQRRIGEILNTLDKAIRKTEQVVAKLQQMKQGLLHDLLTRGIDENGELRDQERHPEQFKESELGRVPRGWEVHLLDDVAFRGSGHTPAKNVPAYWNGGIKWVSLADSNKLDRIYISETDKNISSLGIDNSSAVKHPAGTVILSRDAGIGKSSVLACEMAVSQHFMAWRCGDMLDNIYLYYWLQHQKSRFEAIAMGSTIKTIGLAYFKSLKITLPPIQEQRISGKSLLAKEELIAAEVCGLEKLRRLKRGLMDDLLTGRVRVPIRDQA
jgi:type I restriction enzyme S subunit